MAAYDAICFDLDGTICTPTQDPAALLERTFADAGVEPFCTPADLRAEVPTLPTVETDREFFEALFDAAARSGEADPTVVTTLADHYLENRDPSAVRFRPGAERAIERARERGPVALVTNGSRPTQTRKLRALGIADAFDARVFTEPSAGIYPKPDAAPFEYVLGELDVEPTGALHVGDSLRADVAGANAMGLDSAWVGEERDDASEHVPTYELASLESLGRIV